MAYEIADAARGGVQCGQMCGQAEARVVDSREQHARCYGEWRAPFYVLVGRCARM